MFLDLGPQEQDCVVSLGPQEQDCVVSLTPDALFLLLMVTIPHTFVSCSAQAVTPALKATLTVLD